MYVILLFLLHTIIYFTKNILNYLYVSYEKRFHIEICWYSYYKRIMLIKRKILSYKVRKFRVVLIMVIINVIKLIVFNPCYCLNVNYFLLEIIKCIIYF